MIEEKKLISKDKKSNVEKTTSIEKIENGFVITRNSNWNDAKGNYHYETKKWFAKENPLSDVEKTLASSFK